MRYARTPHVTLAAILLAAVASAVPSTVTAQEKDEAFKAGVEAMKDKQWPTVVTEMRRAIQEDSKESTRKVGRVFGRTDYLPHYFLGEAYFKQNDCVNAVLAWEASLKQGVVQTRPEYFSQLQKGNAACEEKGILLAEKFGVALSRARTQIDSAGGALTKVKDKGNDNLGVWRSQPPFDAAYQRASGEYDAARKHFQEAQRSRLESDFTEVAKAADRAKELTASLDRDLTAAIVKLQGIATEAEAVRQSVKGAQAIDIEIDALANYLDPALKASRADGQKALENAREQLDSRRLSASTLDAARTSVTEGAGLLKKVLESVKASQVLDNKRKLDRAAGFATAAFSRADAEMQTVESLMERYPAKATPELRRSIEMERKQLDSARRKHDAAMRSQLVAGVDAAAKQADVIQASLVAIEKRIGGQVTLEDRGVPTWLQEGAARYFEGDYAGALDKLDDGTVEGTAQLHAYLFRAAAQHALYVRSGEQDTKRRDQAIADVKQCKALALDPNFALDTRVFSPKFIEFYKQDGAAPQPASRTQ